MLIGCITGPDLETVKRQLEMARKYCDGIELRKDLLDCDVNPTLPFTIITDHHQSRFSDERTISTYHNYEETPENLEQIFFSLPKADFYKIATMANKSTDALRMLAFVKDKPNLAGMCMGPLGQITRILGPVVCNPFTFAALGPEAAPGQMQAEELVETYRFHRLSPQTKIYGLIGNPVAQSPGHLFHNEYFQKEGIDAVYVRILLQEDELPLFFSLVQQIGFSGLSVTIPFKEKVLPFMDTLEKEAKEIGAVNTLTFKEGRISGANTDGVAALDVLEENTSVLGKQIVILGDGGASKAIAYEAKKRGAKVNIVSRRLGNLHQIPSYDVLINTIPIIPESSQLNKKIMDVDVTHHFGRAMFEKQAKKQLYLWGFTPKVFLYEG